MPSGEDELIARYFRPLATAPGALGLTDDAAFYAPPEGHELVITTDAIVSGIHFLPDDPPETVARKALRVNLSDLAAKGAAPAGFVLTLALRDVDHRWLTAFAQGLGEDAASFACPLLGGDTVSTPGPPTISITAFGRVAAGSMVRRSGARAGDAVVVTGTIGDATLGLALLKPGSASPTVDAAARKMLVERYRVPQPRVALAAAVRDYAHAAMDVSDGLAGDLAKLCKASGLSAEIRLEQIPVSPQARALIAAKATTIDALIAGGDDYEILCAIPENQLAAFMSAATAGNVAAAVIGVIRDGQEPPRFVAPDGRELKLKRGSFSHF